MFSLPLYYAIYVVVWRSNTVLVSLIDIALHRARLVLGWATDV